MLYNPFNMKPVQTDFADNSPLVNRFRKYHNQRTLDSIKHRLQKFIRLRPNQQESGFTMFGIALGDNAQMPKADEQYCWDKAIECFGDNDDCKKFLGSMLMQAFATDEEQDWFYVQDPEKKFKLSNGETPIATKYFLPRDSNGNIVTKQNNLAKRPTPSTKTVSTNVNNLVGSIQYSPEIPKTGKWSKSSAIPENTPHTLASLAEKFNRKFK